MSRPLNRLRTAAKRWAQSDETRAALRRWAGYAPALLVVVLGYVFFGSAGLMRDWPTHTTFLDDLAEGLRRGHLHMIVEPSPELLAKANPLDPVHRPLWYWDASLYNGHYYLYWGPVPALGLALFKIIFRISAQIPDQYPVFVLAVLQAIAGTMLIDRAARRLFAPGPSGAGLPFAWPAMAVLAFGLVATTSYNMGRPSVYEAAIIGGAAFTLLGIVAAFDGVVLARAGAAGARRRFVAAGLCWALALGCRISVGPALPVLAVVTALAAVGPGPRLWRRRLIATLWMGIPIALAVFLLLAYNKARFGGWLEFGRDRQMSWLPFGVSAAYIPLNVYSYVLRPVVLRCTFPFIYVLQSMGGMAFPRWFHAPPGYDIGEPVGGVFVTAPWTWLGLVALVVGARAFWRALRGWRQAEETTVLAAWLVASLALSAFLSSLVTLPLYTSTNRYEGDFINQTVVLASLGGFWLRTRFVARPWLRRTLDASAVLLVLATIAIGVALGINGQYTHTKIYNPALMSKMERAFSVCGE